MRHTERVPRPFFQGWPRPSLDDILIGLRLRVAEPLSTQLRRAKIMAVPKRRTSHARQGKRRSHLHIKPIQVQYCSQCNEPVLPHRVCPNCGQYQGREVVVAEEK